MKHDIVIDGFAYRLRPVTLEDAPFIVASRLEDKERNKFINPISPDPEKQKDWIEAYFKREDDYYFVIENVLTHNPEGLIGIYDIHGGKGEWGRWVVKKGSLAAVESVDLMYKAAFNALKLNEIYCRTVAKNLSVASFHDTLPQPRRATGKPPSVQIDGIEYEMVEHFVTAEYYAKTLCLELEKKARQVFQRNFRLLFGQLDFHHLGVATANIEKEFDAYRLLGYSRDGDSFEDPAQGIRGQFITAEGQPRLELLENLSGSSILNTWLNAGIKFYHVGFKVKEIEKLVTICNRNRIKIISPLKPSVYFGTRICFLALPNAQVIELIEA